MLPGNAEFWHLTADREQDDHSAGLARAEEKAEYFKQSVKGTWEWRLPLAFQGRPFCLFQHSEK